MNNNIDDIVEEYTEFKKRVKELLDTKLDKACIEKLETPEQEE